MKLVDAWRLFGPNLQTPGPAALVEVAFDPTDDVGACFGAWTGELARMGREVGFVPEGAAARAYHGGAVFTFPAPSDVLLPATDLAEWAATSASSVVAGQGASPLEPQRSALAEAFVAHKNPALLALEAEAERRGVPLLWDDDAVTLGAGARSARLSRTSLPTLADVPWALVGTIPIALVTGTNGKTTSVRLLARILKHAGHVVGMTTTDGVSVDETLALRGDYTGPAGAAKVLADPRVDAAVLETARGGILRRGVVARPASVALLTNVSEDHLGHYGIDDLATLARVKAVVGTVVARSGRVVVNADDPFLMAEARRFEAPRVLFSVDPSNAALAAHVASGGDAWTVREGWIVVLGPNGERPVVRVSSVPIAFGGAAPYNVANALGAAAAASALGVDDAVIGDGVASFHGSPQDNPGRGNLIDVGGVQVLVDFAHNPAGIASVLGLARRIHGDGARLFVAAGYAGDRSNESLLDAARIVRQANPAAVTVRDLQGYLRGRAAGEVPRLFQAELVRLGMPEADIEAAASEGEALERLLRRARPGDVVVVLAHLEDGEVEAALDAARRNATPKR